MPSFGIIEWNAEIPGRTRPVRLDLDSFDGPEDVACMVVKKFVCSGSEGSVRVKVWADAYSKDAYVYDVPFTWKTVKKAVPGEARFVERILRWV